VNVLQLVDTFSAGGAERLLATITGLGPARGLHSDVAALTDEGPRAAMAPLLRAAGADPVSLGFRRLADPRGLGRLLRHLRTRPYDVVHAHLEYSTIAGAVATSIARLPFVVTLHHVSAPPDRRSAVIERAAVETGSRRAARVIFVSHASRDSFAARYRPRRNWTVLPNGVELPDLRARSEHERVPRAVLVGTMRPGKGHADAVDAWRQVIRRVPDAELVFVGDGDLEFDLRRHAANTGVGHRVRFAGFTHDVHGEIAAADVVLLPSRQEALPTVLMEAAALGKPVVATDVGGVREVVRHGETGLLVREHDPTALADAVTCLFGDAARRQDLGTAARSRACSDFDARAWIGRLADIYARAVR
jgi:glycosyltransferase involved in cell wall biosynthesis